MEQNPYHVNYQQILESVGSDELDSIIHTLAEQLPHDWVNAYRLANRTHANVLRIKRDGCKNCVKHCKGDGKSPRAEKGWP